jgi:hypothetical protein
MGENVRATRTVPALLCEICKESLAYWWAADKHRGG